RRGSKWQKCQHNKKQMSEFFHVFSLQEHVWLIDKGVFCTSVHSYSLTHLIILEKTKEYKA
ncbi:hypothetical protein, partial [Enterococcus faecium]|uniref:hypothetical protein n=1 Tax=Enterococcus faecium TaxID=1352 RepID=UPI0020918E34